VLRDERDLKLALVVLLLGIVLQALLAIVQARTGTSLGLEFLGESRSFLSQQLLTFEHHRAPGTLLHPNMLAAYLDMILFVGIAPLLVLRLTVRMIPVAFASMLGVAGLIITLSRGGWLAFVVASAVLFALIYILVPPRRLLVLGLSLSAVMAIALAAVLPTVVHERLV
jgi:hypothetical protein